MGEVEGKGRRSREARKPDPTSAPLEEKQGCGQDGLRCREKANTSEDRLTGTQLPTTPPHTPQQAFLHNRRL